MENDFDPDWPHTLDLSEWDISKVTNIEPLAHNHVKRDEYKRRHAMSNDFDPDWPHGHVVDDCPARIVCRDRKGDYPIVATVPGEDGKERLFSYTRSGRYYKGGEASILDLRNAPAPKKRVTGWANIYSWGMSSRYDTKAEADESASNGRIACIYIDVGEGEGL